MSEPAAEGHVPPAGTPSGPRAGFGSRLLATIVDTVIVLAVAGVLVGILYAVGGEGAAIVGYVIAIIIVVAYFTYFEGGAAGQTLGKKVSNIRVIDARTGGPIGYPRAFGRYLVESIVSGSICFLGYLWMLWDGEKQTWHDKIVGSLVVPTDAYPVDRS